MTTNNELATVEIRCFPDNLYILSGVLNKKNVRFDIETKSTGKTLKRTPLNLVLILDRSGSMKAANKLTFAKQAVISVLNLLHDDDIVHLVAYDTDVSIIFENVRASFRQDLYHFVNNINAAGSTNMSDAIKVAASLLNKYVYDGFSRRMFLFSDGQANVEMITRVELTKLVAEYNNKGIITDSFGIGADFDSEIMKGIADAGGSRFYFLESSQVIERLVTKALVCVFGVCASQTRLIVRGKNGAIVTKIWGHKNIIAGASLGDLHIDNLRSILCEFTMIGTATANENDIETLTYELRYNQPNDLTGEPTVIKNSLVLKCVEDETLVTNVDPCVKTMCVTQKAAKMDKRISQLVNNDQRREAIDLTREKMKLLQDIESFDTERGIVSILLRLSKNMHSKLTDETIDKNLVCRSSVHNAHLIEECDREDMGLYLN